MKSVEIGTAEIYKQLGTKIFYTRIYRSLDPKMKLLHKDHKERAGINISLISQKLTSLIQVPVKSAYKTQ